MLHNFRIGIEILENTSWRKNFTDSLMMESSRHGERATFQNCLKRLLKITHRDDVSSKTDINVLVDELIALDYSQKFVDEEVYS